MALRVLLADESSTIKKVMQLALQDFGVEVRSVPVGLDVLAITKEFKPDIIFVDVLLSKRSGYDVCQDLKHDPVTNHLPVILMWSSFMDVDASKFNSSGANDRLEKPFDAEALRRLVTEFVVKTQTNEVSPFLQFPEMPEMPEMQEDAPTVKPTAKPAPFESTFKPAASQNEIGSVKSNIPVIQEEEVLEIDDIDFGEEFAQVPLHMNTSEKEKKAQSPLVDSWTQENIGKIKVPAENNEIDSDFAKKYLIPQDEDSSSLPTPPRKVPPPAEKAFLSEPDEIDINDIHFEELEEISTPKDLSQTTSTQIPLTSPPKKMDLAKVTAATAHHTQKLVSDQLRGSQIDPEAERILREEARSVLESIAWKLVPDIAERVVREEIQKLLREVEKSV